MKPLYTIGEFSQITGLSIKTLRFYHERRILLPSSIDESSGYRFYDEGKIEKARVIMWLRRMEFPLEDIAAVLGDCDDDAEILNHLEGQKQMLQQRIQADRDIVRSLNQIIAREREAQQLLERGAFKVDEKPLEPLLIAGIRMKGRYSECGAGFSRLAKAVGRFICGKAMCLYHDGEYREDDANFEPCFPMRKEIAADGISVRQLPAANCLTLIHPNLLDSCHPAPRTPKSPNFGVITSHIFPPSTHYPEKQPPHYLIQLLHPSFDKYDHSSYNSAC